MSGIDWLILIVFVVGLTGCAVYTRRFVSDVTSFLAADRCGGRYMISVSNGMAGLCVISLVYFFQIGYDTGFTSHWWMQINAPAVMLVAVTGWVMFRFRQTRAMTLAQFFEMRYSRSFRVFSGLVAFISGILNFGIFPSVGARFFILFCGLPDSFALPGTTLYIQTFPFLMFVLLAISVFFTFIGGLVTVMFTDFLQGILISVIFVITVVFLLFTFSKAEFQETLLAAPPGHSLVNPYDLGNEVNFNPTYYFISVFIVFYGTLCWQGTAGFNCCAKTPHEAKMANILAPWRFIATVVLLSALAPAAIHVYLKHPHYADRAAEAKEQINRYVMADLKDAAQRDRFRADDLEMLSGLDFRQVRALDALRGVETAELTRQSYQDIAPLKNKSPDEISRLARLLYDRTNETTSQTRIPVVLSRILPTGLMGLFCIALLAAFISTHNSYLHSWGSMFIQDVVLPFRKKPISQKANMQLLRAAVIGVAVYVFIFSLNFRHSQRIMMYCQITASVFLSGAGTVIIGGLYWKRGTATAAWAAMTTGLILSILGIFTTQSGVSAVDSAEQMPFWMGVSDILRLVRCDELFWSVARFIFGLNSQVVLFLTCCIAISVYVIVSLLTCRQPFNLDKMLHRGKYKTGIDDSATLLEAKTVWNRLGFTQDFTKGDNFIGAVSLIWPLFWFAVFIVGTVFRDKISDFLWFQYWYVWVWIIFTVVVITVVWFAVGGFYDFGYFLRTLKKVAKPAPEQTKKNQKTKPLISVLLLAGVLCMVGCHKTLAIAHRGNSGSAPENTLAAVRSAWTVGADAVEIDVHLTSDNHIVVIHDYDTERAAGRKRVIAQSTFAELAELDVGSFYSPHFRGETIPLLDEVIATIPGRRKLFVEIKSDSTILPHLKDVIDLSGKRANIVIIAFNLETLTKAKKMMPDIPMYWLVSPNVDENTGLYLPYETSLIDVAKAADLDGLNVYYVPLTEAFVRRTRAAGLGLYVWTVNKTADIQRMLDVGVDGITTDHPADMIQLRK